MLPNEYLAAKISFDTAESGTSEVLATYPRPPDPLGQLNGEVHSGQIRPPVVAVEVIEITYLRGTLFLLCVKTFYLTKIDHVVCR